MRKFQTFVLCAVIATSSIFSCRQPAKDDGKPIVVESINIEMQTSEGFAELDKVFPSKEIPYTATHIEVNPQGKFVLKASAKDEKLKNKAIMGKVLKPENSPPLMLRALSNNTFELTFSKVKASTPCSLLFYIEGEQAKKGVEFTLLPEPEITKIECEPAEITLGKNFTYQIKPKLSFAPSKIGTIDASSFVLNATKKISYNSNESSVATVSDTGEVKTIKAGDVSISLKTTNQKEITLKISVEDEISPENLTLSHEYINLKMTETKDITISPQPSNGSLAITDWTNSNTSVGKIEKKNKSTYTITAISKGETTFEATSKYNPNLKLTIHLTVSDKLVESVKIEPPRISLEKDESKTLKVTITPSEAPQKVKWESNLPEIVSVDENGKITAKDFGVAVIKAISLADSTKIGTCVVIVAASAGNVSLNKELLELKYGESFTLIASIDPPTAPQEVIWSCDNTDILTYTSSGVITAKNETGKAIVTATSMADSSKKAQCIVYVARSKVESIKLSEESFEMDTNGEKDFSVEVLPYDATSELEYEIEGDNLELKKFEKTNNYGEIKYNCTVKAGNLEEIKKITFKSKANPEINAILNITTIAPKVQSVTVKDKTIALDTMTEKMEAIIVPANAVQTVTWISKNTDIVMIDENTGGLTPIKAGEATVEATSTADPTKKGEAKVVVKASITSFEIAINKSSIYFGGDSATLTVIPTPIDAFGGFVCETENEDLEITTVDENTFSISVKNKSAKKANATLKVKSNTKPSIPEQTKEIKIKTIIPSSISIIGDDKIYLSEELQFSINATSTDYGGPTPDKSVKWEFDKSYSSSMSPYNVEVKEDGKVKLENPNHWDAGKRFRIKATSLLDDSVVATKVITVCKDVIKITSVECRIKEWTNCKETNEDVYNGKNSLNVVIKFSNNEYHAYKKFVVSESSSYWDTPSSNYLEKVVYEATPGYFGANACGITLSTKNPTFGKARKFYVWPIDPKTEKPITTGVKHTFDLLIWAEPEEIEFEKGNFNYFKNTDGGFQSSVLEYGSSGYYFYARISPMYANQELLTYEIKRVSGKYTCIQNAKKSETQDRSGWIRYEFSTNGNNTMGAHDYADFVFDIKVGNRRPNPRISNYLRIDSN